ncbi:NAD(P)/FAD-dependent oxidoreductase [Stella sp.]|uniref:FAD/NAD(P)-dependent oxidoreductase n=1 Tax=Stella sp. TaxID=2912054 RepID=UPI0035AE66F4
MSAAAETVVVGAGPAGAAAALALAEAGLAVTLVDDNARAGGQVFRTGAAGGRRGPGRRGPGRDPRGAELRARLAATPGIDHRPDHEVVAIHPDRSLWVRADDGRLQRLAPRLLLVATGAVEIAVPVPGWQRPGVFGLGGLQLLLKGAGTVPTGPVVLAGAGPLLYLLAAQLRAHRVPVAAVVDAAARPGFSVLLGLATQPSLLAAGIGHRWRLLWGGIPVLRRHAVTAVDGDRGGVTGVEVAPVDDDWRPLPGGRRRIAARTLGLGFGVRPNIELTRLAGAEHGWDVGLGGWFPKRSDELETTVPGLFAAGDGAGVLGVDNALDEGLIAAAAIARRLGRGGVLDWRAEAAIDRRRRRRVFREALADWSALRPGVFAAAGADTVVCRCEDVTAGEIADAVRLGYRAPGPLKMATRAGMGLCQGRVCATAVQHLLAAAAGTDPGAVPPPSVRVPLRPVPLDAFAGMAAD